MTPKGQDLTDRGPTDQSPILIAGQTASGKSGLALRIAGETDGVIINADSMQVYEELQILSARPTRDEMQGIPHLLFGHVPASTPYSVGHWLADIEPVLENVRQQGKTPIIVGGTGLYFKALLHGLSPVPDIPPAIRDKWRQRALDPAFDLHASLKDADPDMAERLLPGDRQRLARALEVHEATGRSLAYWQQQQPKTGLLDEKNTVKLVIGIDRAELYARCDRRFDQMMERGALDEVEKLLTLNLPSSLPSMRALGVPPLCAFLSGAISLQQAVERAKTETRQYAKRQNTWLKSNMITWKEVQLKQTERNDAEILANIKNRP